ncbi:hypothetical protein C8R42DRAFT_575604 [Lentinula raphanica]|nr:hypothetical protein C8R42DRAFT_575604 [Lentinula raphanica]
MKPEVVHPSAKSPNQVFTCKGWTLDHLLTTHKNFHAAPRLEVSDAIEDAIAVRDAEGLPFVIQGLQSLEGWKHELLNLEWLKINSPSNEITVRNIHNNVDTEMPFLEFLNKTRNIDPFVQDGERERLYGKDLETPLPWIDWLYEGKVVPSSLRPTTNNLSMYLPDSAKVDTLMNYIGTGDTFTPSHKDLCASHGHNLMCYTENGGSSFWFMTKRQDARKVADYFHDKLGHDIDHENHVTSIEDFANAPFPVYIVEQKMGDLVMVPRMSCHQVVNHGGLTVKMSWSRMSLKSIADSVYYELPLYRRVCRQETYRVRLTLFYTIRALYKKFTDQMQEHDTSIRSMTLESQARRLTQALRIFDDVLQNECVDNHESLPCYSSSESFESYPSCDFCGADIFQSFLECEHCHSDGDPCTICPGCYAEGRSCRCRLMQPKQYQPLKNILQEREKAIEGLQQYWKSGSAQGVEFAPITYVEFHDYSACS